MKQYWSLAPRHRYSLTFALPLLVAYELLAAGISDDPRSLGLRNGADVLLKSAFVMVAGPHGPAIFMGLVVAVAIWLIWRDRRASGPVQGWVFGAMLAESVALALLLGVVVGTLTAQLLGVAGLATAWPLQAADASSIERLSLPTRLMLSLGAGLYEELAFRVILVAALSRGAQLVFGWKRLGAGVFATVLGALLFSAFHYIGPYGEPLELASFTYRAIAGLVFSVLYLTRGFGITAWTHALYDVWVMVVL